MADMSDYGFELDRDLFIDVARIFGLLRCLFDIVLLHPLAIFVVLKKSSMTNDCKAGYVCHTVLLMGFEIYNGLLYQFYTLAPLPIILCSGLLCKGAVEPATLLTILSFWTVAVCVPYLFLIIRIHQRMLFTGSPLKISDSAQALVLLGVTVLLFSNVFGFHRWTVDIPNKNHLLDSKVAAWANNFSSNFLVMGERLGDIGPFINELVLLLVSIAIIFSFYIFITYHALYKVGRSLNFRKSKISKVHLSSLYSLTMQAIASAIFFISPLLGLFLGLRLYQEEWKWPPLMMPFTRATFLLLFVSFPFWYSFIFLVRNRWCREMFQRAISPRPVPHPTVVTTVSKTH